MEIKLRKLVGYKLAIVLYVVSTILGRIIFNDVNLRYVIERQDLVRLIFTDIIPALIAVQAAYATGKRAADGTKKDMFICGIWLLAYGLSSIIFRVIDYGIGNGLFSDASLCYVIVTIIGINSLMIFWPKEKIKILFFIFIKNFGPIMVLVISLVMNVILGMYVAELNGEVSTLNNNIIELEDEANDLADRLGFRRMESVFITAHGKKYHRAICDYLNDDDVRIDVAEARQLGYEPCSVCNP